MEQFEGFMEYLLNSLVNTAIHLFELVGVIVLIVAGVSGVVNYIRHDPMVRLKLAQGMALCLEVERPRWIRSGQIKRPDLLGSPAISPYDFRF